MRARVLALIALALVSGPTTSGATLEDLDGDGLSDAADVGDWDGDGILEMDDIRQALLALQDPGLKILRLAAGRFLAPESTTNHWGILELPNNTVLEGVGWDTILEGMSGDCDSAASCPYQVAVVANEGIESIGNVRIVVRNLQIDGRATAEYSGTYTPSRAGIRFTTARDIVVENVWVHHTYHTCLYTSDSRDVRFVGNLAHDCGGFDRVHPEAATYPGVYVYANQRLVQRILIAGNRISRTGFDAVNFRKASRMPLPRLEDVSVVDNEIHDTVGIRTTARCLNTSGVDGMTVVGNTCRATGGVQVTPAEAYFDRSSSSNASRRVLIDDLAIEDTPRGHPLEIGWHSSESTFRDVRIRGSSDGTPCVVLFDPVRAIFLDSLDLVDCGGPGFRTYVYPGLGVTGSGQRIGENLHLRDIEVVRTAPWPGAPYPALQFLDDVRSLRVESLRVSGPFQTPVRFHGSVFGTLLRHCPFDEPGGPCSYEAY